MFSKKKKVRIIKTRELKNPIENNRIVDSITFATRFSNFLKDIQVNDAIGEEELDYMKYVASKLLVYQMATIESEAEKEYFRNLGYKI